MFVAHIERIVNQWTALRSISLNDNRNLKAETAFKTSKGAAQCAEMNIHLLLRRSQVQLPSYQQQTSE